MGKAKRVLKHLRQRKAAAPAVKPLRAARRSKSKSTAAPVAAPQPQVVDENPYLAQTKAIVWLDANMHSAIEYDRGHTIVRFVALDRKIYTDSDSIEWFEKHYTPVPDYWPSKAALVYMESFLRKTGPACRELREVLMEAVKQLDVKKASMKELLAYYNAHAPKPVEKFASETAARKACEILQERMSKAAATQATPTADDNKEQDNMSTAQAGTSTTKKSKSAAKASKVKETKKATKGAAKSNKSGQGGRAAKFDHDKKITVVSKEHGYREGSSREQLFKLIKSGMTVGKYLEAGGSTRAIERAVEAKLIKVS